MSMGMAKDSPMIVVISASHMPAARRAGLGAAFSAMVRKTETMPSTVPSSPSRGEMTETSRIQHRLFVTRAKFL